MKLTVRQLKAVYVMLSQFPPLVRWNLPPVGDVRFAVRLEKGSSEEVLAHYNITPAGRHEISFDGHAHWTMTKLIAIMAHEIVHLRQEMLGRRPNSDHQHNGTFKRLAAQVCSAMGYDGADF